MRPLSDGAHLEVATDLEVGFSALYRAEYARMVRLAVLLVDVPAQAEEIVQDAFAAVYRRWDRIDSPPAFLRRTVVNRGRDALRRRRVVRRHRPVPEVWHDAPDELGDAIGRLPASQRTAVVLRFYEDLTIDQVAEVMGARPGTVKSWLHRAMATLRGEIER